MQIERTAANPIASGFHNPEADLQATPYPDDVPGSPVQTALIEATINPFNQRFSELAQDEKTFHQVFQAAFGRNYHASIAEQIRTQTLIGDLSFLPNVRLVSSNDLQGHLGAYQADKQIIYLDESADAQSLGPVFMEEVGHHFDTLMSTTDATGDVFVQGYRHFLGREADAGGYAAYQDALTQQNGGITPKGFANELGVDGQKVQLTRLPEGTYVATLSHEAPGEDGFPQRTQISVLWQDENHYRVQVSQEAIIGNGRPTEEEVPPYRFDILTVTPTGTEGNAKLRDFAEGFVGSVFEGFNDAREELASDLADFALDYQRNGFYATGPGQTFQNIGEFVSSELFEAIHGDPTNTRTAHFLSATGDFISDWWNNKESTISSAKDYWQTAGNSLSEFIEQTDGKTLGHMAGHAVGDALFQATTGSLAAKGVTMGAQGLGDLVSQAAPLIGKADKTPDARKALEQFAAEGKIDTSAPVKTGAGDGTMPVEGVVSNTKVLTKAERLEVQQALQTRVDDIRAGLPKKLQGSGNMGFAQVDIPGLPTELKAHSRINYPSDKGAEGFEHLADESEWIFKPKAVDPDNVRVGTPDAYVRQWDTEFKILNDVALRLGNNRNATGSINLFTERLTCTSCTDVIFDFKARYPNIQLNVFAGE